MFFFTFFSVFQKESIFDVAPPSMHDFLEKLKKHQALVNLSFFFMGFLFFSTHVLLCVSVNVQIWSCVFFCEN